jgi:hypothetical protein
VDGALAAARAVYEAVASGELDPVKHIGLLGDAAEPLWDHPNGDPSLVLRVVRDIQPAFRYRERFGGLRHPDRLELRVRPMVLLMRAEYRMPEPGQARKALQTALAALTFLEDYVDGRDALTDVLQHSANPVAEATVAVLGLYAAALPKAELPPRVRDQYRGIWIRLARAYVMEGGPQAIYPRTEAFASQGLYLCAEDRRPGEEPLVHAFFQLDLRTRPQHVRAQATAPKRDAVYAKYCGDTAGLRRHRRLGIEQLERLSLKRQLAELRAIERRRGEAA